MVVGKQGLARPLLGAGVAILLASASVNAQEVVPMERLDDWFYSRLGWGLLVAAIAGALVGGGYVSRLRFPPGLHQINNLARRRLAVWLVLLFGLGGLWLLLDASSYQFTDYPLEVADAFRQVWLNWRTLVTLLAATVSFLLLVAVTTRYVPWSRCPYTLWPSPRVNDRVRH